MAATRELTSTVLIITAGSCHLLVLLRYACWQVWRETLWTGIRTDVMEEGTKSFVKEVKALPKQIRDEDCFKVYILVPIMLCWADLSFH